MSSQIYKSLNEFAPTFKERCMSDFDAWILNDYSELSRYKWEGDMEIRGGITFYEAEAYKLFPEGCQCGKVTPMS